MPIQERDLASYQEVFCHRTDLYSQQTPTGYFLRRSPITPTVIRNHLEGRITAGWYALQPVTNSVRWVVLDADQEDGRERLRAASKRLDQRGIASCLELSRLQRAHLWVYFDPIPAQVARRLILGILPDLGAIEVFPKQDRLLADHVGSAVRGPLGIHRKSGERYPFVDPISLTPVSGTISGTIDFLAEVKRVSVAEAAGQLATLLDEARRPPDVPKAPSPPEVKRFSSPLTAEDVKQRIGDIHTFVSRFVDLDASDRGHCPFHPPDEHSSFVVDRSRGYWVCFHEVNPRTGRYLGGDAISFYMRLGGLPFREALTELASLIPAPEINRPPDGHDGR